MVTNKLSSIPVTAGGLIVDLFAEAAKRAGRKLTKEKLIEALHELRDFQDPFGSPPYPFTLTNHWGTERAFISQVKNGKFVKISGFIS